VDPRVLLEAVGRRAPGQAVLWRGPRIDGRDIDVAVAAAALPEVCDALREAGLQPAPGDPGHLVFGGGLEVDLLPEGAWPAGLPAFAGVLRRARPEAGAPLPVASPEDRALVFCAEALAGRPVEKSLVRARALLEDPEVAGRARAVAREEGLEGLLALADADPQAVARRGRLPWAPALRAAAGSPAARAVVARRAASRLGRAPGGPRPLLVAISGMDGAGKSTLADALVEHLVREGRPAERTWARLGSERKTLDRIAIPVKRLLRREGTIGDPVAAGGPTVEKVQDPREAAGRRRLMSWGWILFVAVSNARSYRRAARRRRAGVSLVCDRWLTDALVDLEVRYGRHGGAERALRWLVPRADVAVLLQLDAATAEARKPGDQARWALERAEALYARHGSGLHVVPATLPPAEVLARVVAALPR
jgi:hypothetical protein